MIIDKIKKILTTSERKKAQDIILSVEIMANKSNIPVSKIIEKMIELGEKNSYVREVMKRIKSKKYNKKHEIYQGILDDDIVNILKSASDTGVSGEEVIHGYIESKKSIAKVAGKIRGGVIEPLIVYFLISCITWVGIVRLKAEFSKISGFNVDTLNMVLTIMPFVVFVPTILTIIGVFFYPHKMPFVKGIWNHIKSTMYLSLMSVLFKLNLYSRLINFFLEMKDKSIIKAYKKLPASKKKKQTEGLMAMLSSYLDPTERSLLSLAVSYNNEREVIETIAEQRLGTIESRAIIISVMFNRLGIVATLLPIVIYVFCMFSSVTQVMDLASKKSSAGGGPAISSSK